MLQRLVVAAILAACFAATIARDIDVSKEGVQHDSLEKIEALEEIDVRDDPHQDVNSFHQEISAKKGSQDEFARKSSVRQLKRSRRSLIIPGTNWCGVGNVSRNSSEVGDIVGTDKCCRQHDYCPYTIEGFSTKYNMFNYRFHTFSHCECDDIFRTCLRMATSDQANLIGELYFNIIGMKCFVFKRETICAERAWWGMCERETTRSVAEMRDPLAY